MNSKFWVAEVLGIASCVAAAWCGWAGIGVPIYIFGVVGGLCISVVWRAGGR